MSILDKAPPFQYDTIEMDMTDQVKDAIDRCGLSRYKIAKLSGVSQGMLSKFVNGRLGMSLSTLDRLAPTLGLTLVFKKPSPRKGR